MLLRVPKSAECQQTLRARCLTPDCEGPFRLAVRRLVTVWSLLRSGSLRDSAAAARGPRSRHLTALGISGDPDLATSWDFFMATDIQPLHEGSSDPLTQAPAAPTSR